MRRRPEISEFGECGIYMTTCTKISAKLIETQKKFDKSIKIRDTSIPFMTTGRSNR